jgi:putative ABC transport system permease protein
MTFEMRMAWRETRPAWKRFLFVIAAIALGVSVLTGLKGFSHGLNRSIYRSARELIAADLAVRTNSLPGGNDVQILESLTQKGARLTRITETLSMVSPSKTANPILSDIRAVDPKVYPFYGTVELEPRASLNQVLSDTAAVVSRDLLVRCGIAVGDEIQVGSAHLRISAILKSEPDRIGVGVDLGPRILITRAALERSGLIQFGSRASESFLYLLPAKGLTVDQARNFITSRIKRRIRITDFRDPNPSITRGLERATNFLSLLGLLSLLVGGLGVSTTVRTYLQQKLDSIAIIKCVGGRSKQIIRIYLIQGLSLGAIGSAIGTGLGYIVQLLLPRLLKGLIDLPANLELAPGAALQGFVIGVFTTLIFLLAPLLAIRTIKPVRVFLREMPEPKWFFLKRLRADPLPAYSAIVLLGGIGLAASWLAESWRWGFAFLAIILVCILVLLAAANGLLALLKRVPHPPSIALRHGIRNLNRPGTHAASIMATLGLGVAFILTIYFIQTSLISQILRSAPANFPNVILLGITGSDRKAVSEYLTQQQGIESVTLVPSVSSRLLRINGRPPEQMETDQEGRRYRQIEFTLTWSDSVPPDTKIIEGRWWQPPFNTPLISVGEDAVRHLKIRIGDILQFDVSGSVVQGKVANIRETEFSRPGAGNQFIFSPGALAGLPTGYIGGLQLPADRVPEFQSSFFRRFPNVTTIDVGQVLTRVQDLLNKIALVIRFVALFAIASGVIILAASVVSTRHQRTREVVLLKTLGATRAQIGRIQSAEFLILGSAAGFVGGSMAGIAAHYLLGNLLKTDFSFQWIPFLTAIIATAMLSIGTGWVASRGVLNHKPLQTLREN